MKPTGILILSAVLAVLGVGQSAAFELNQNCPNPFSAQTCITFELVAPQRVNLNIYDLRGAKVRTLLDGAALTEDRHEATWDGRDDAGRGVPEGVYFLRIEAGTFSATQKMLLVR